MIKLSAAAVLDAQLDAVIDGALGRLREVVAAKLGTHPALDDLDEEIARDGQVSELTRQQVELAVTSAARKDDAFGQAVAELVRHSARTTTCKLSGAAPRASGSRTTGPALRFWMNQ